MGLPGVGAAVLGGGSGGGASVPVTPGAGSSGFTPPGVVIVADAAGALDDASPAGEYYLVPTGGSDVRLRPSLDASGPGSIFAIVPLVPAAAGAAGYDVEMDGGAGAAGSGATPGGAGALAQFYGGFGGAGTALAAAGRGGDVYVTSAPGGANGGGGGARGGDLFLDGSDGTGGQRSGDVILGETTVGVWGTRYVRIGPDGGSIPLLVDRAAPVSGELFNVRSGADTLALIGQVALGSWSGAGEATIGHYTNRALATGYAVRASATTTLLNAGAAAGLLYLTCGGGVSQGWSVGDGVGATFPLIPLTNNAFDLGTTARKVRDIHTSRDVYVGDDIEFLTASDHDVYVANHATVAGSLFIRAASTTSSGNGGNVSIDAGAATTTAPGTPYTGGSVFITAKDGAGDASVGGSVVIEAGGASATQGSIDLGLASGCPVNVGAATALLSFYGAAGTAQPATPVTLGDVIAALQALGLVA